MARLFDDGATEYLEYGNAILTGVPLSMACWFNSDDIAISQALMSISRTDANHWFDIRLRGNVGGDPVTASTYAGDFVSASTSTGYSANTWHHACGVFAAATDRRAFIDGGSKGTNAGNEIPVGLNRTNISGLYFDASVLIPISGRIALPAIWNVTLSDAEILWLARGGWPGDCRPGNLKFFAPLHGPATTGDADFSSTPKYNMKPVNSPTWAEGPRNMDALFTRKYSMGA